MSILIKKLQDYMNEGIVKDRTVLDILDTGRKKYADRVALVDAEKKVTYKELWERAVSVARIFRDNGIECGNHVILWFNNRIEYFDCLFGLMMVGAVPVLLLPTHRKKELYIITGFGECKAIVTYGKELGFDYLGAAIDYVDEVDKNVKIFSYEASDRAVSLNRESTVSDFKTADISGNDTALFLLSGGTTDIPKMIPKKHAAYYYNTEYCAKRCGTGEDSVYLAVLSVSHDYPLSCPGVLGTMLYGGKSVLSMTASFDEISNWVRKERTTFTQIAPAVLSMWLTCMEWEEKVDFSSMRYIQVGAAKLERELAEKTENELGVKILQGYGLGEGITCFTGINDDREISWTTQGTPISEYDEIRIVDENNEEVPNGVAGELTERGPYTFEGYFKADKRNKEVFTEDGFFRTGDKALITPDGRVQILGRIREQINRAGENIIPSEIEEYLKKCKGVYNAAVFGLPDPELGEKICAVLTAEKQKELTELCRELSAQGLAPFKLPDVLYYTDEMPLINVGKIDKKKLKEKLELL